MFKVLEFNGGLTSDDYRLLMAGAIWFSMEPLGRSHAYLYEHEMVSRCLERSIV